VIPENLARARRFFWLGKSLALLGAVVVPFFVFVATMAIVSGHAQKEYFEAVSQILPVLLLALAIEQRYFTGSPQLPPNLEFNEADTRRVTRFYTFTARLYALSVLFALGLGEWIAVEVLATGESSTTDLKATAGSLAAGFTALIVTALVGTKRAD
jgi:hypothetical protein